MQGISIVNVDVRNEAGEGQIEIKLTLRDKDGKVVARKEETVTMKAHERLRIAIDVPVGDARGLVVEAEAVYPPD